ncbi:MAG: ABC transporter ATP-binding protein, partial [Clostridia bacterium]|nr:ABC transporter ATP-binding protein [Clostridia bacterium]
DSVITAVNRASIKVEKGEFVAIIGTSGSGKSTFLHICAGLDKPDAGQVIINGTDITKLSHDALGRFRGENMGFIFQKHNLIPQFTALENILIPTMMCNKADMEYQENLRHLVESLDLGERLNHLPSELSGGQQQRVAIARALVKMPKVLLLDEPLSNLDARLRLQTREEIRRIQKETGITTIFVTHDQEEAMSISDMIVVMKLGVVQQIGAPQEVYDDPINLFVAKFLGTPPINVFNGRVAGEKLYIGDAAVLDVPGVADQDVSVGIRPEGFVLDENGPLVCNLNSVEVMGRDVSVVSTHDASVNPAIRSIINADNKVAAGETVTYSLKAHKVFLFDKENENRIYFGVK